MAAGLAGSAVIAWWLGARASERPSITGDSRVRSTVHLENFVVNLADADEKVYLRVGIDLGLETELTRKQEEALPRAQVRDTILEILTRSKSSDLLAAGGKARLKAELAQALQERVPALGVREVYFTEFLIQR